MYECRCQKCNKKLAEIARLPISDFTYSKICKKCGKDVKGEISINLDNDQIVASINCICGYRKDKTIGYLVSIKCKRCKTITRF